MLHFLICIEQTEVGYRYTAFLPKIQSSFDEMFVSPSFKRLWLVQRVTIDGFQCLNQFYVCIKSSMWFKTLQSKGRNKTNFTTLGPNCVLSHIYLKISL